MDLNLNGIKVSVSEPEIAALVRQRLLAQEPAAVAVFSAPPIGSDLDGGLYAGLTLHDGQPHALVLLPGEHKGIRCQDAVSWAAQQGGTLPSRIDQLVMWQNLKAQLQPEWYWSCEQHAGNESYAWYQHFGYGTQLYYYKYDKLRARAVRRVAI